MSIRLIGLAASGVEAVVAPQLGGRILSLRFEGREVLWRDRRLIDRVLQPRVAVERVPLGAGFAQWQNWGGDKTWPAPQGWNGPGAWPGPPDGVLDSGDYDVVECTATTVHLRSGVEPRTGLRIERELRAGPGALTVRSTVSNETGTPGRWAAWEVAQLPFDEQDIASDAAGLEVRMPGESEPVVLFEPVGRLRWHQAGDGVRVPFQEAVGKLGFPGADGSVELVRADGSGVVMAFTVDTDGEYPDGSPFQLWMQTPSGPLPGLDGLVADAAYVELEALSPRVLLAPGQAVQLEVSWRSTSTI